MLNARGRLTELQCVLRGGKRIFERAYQKDPGYPVSEPRIVRLQGCSAKETRFRGSVLLHLLTAQSEQHMSVEMVSMDARCRSSADAACASRQEPLRRQPEIPPLPLRCAVRFDLRCKDVRIL
jgi:hypothetical protein